MPRALYSGLAGLFNVRPFHPVISGGNSKGRLFNIEHLLEVSCVIVDLRIFARRCRLRDLSEIRTA
jgi:hypothetical protein